MILQIILYYLLAVNVITFIVYGIDKLKAKHSWWRISESTLLILAAVGGSLGAWIGMKVWHHKTLHKKFKYGVPLLLVLHVAIIVALSVCNVRNKSKEIMSYKTTSYLQQRVDSLLAVKKMDVGLAVSYHGKILCAANMDKRFPMMSVFKLHQAVAVIDSLANRPMSLDSKILITKDMLHEDTYSPLRDAYPNGNIRMSIEDLLHYTLWQSDNNACDILFSLFGGTSYAQVQMEKLGLHDTQIKWTEDDMHRDTKRCNDNFTTPMDAIILLETAYNNEWLRSCMEECQTGQNRLPALLPKDQVRIGHKTGTGDVLPNGLQMGINDIGFVTLPNGEHYFIAVFCNNSSLSMQETEAVIAELSRMAYSYIVSNTGSHDGMM